MLENKVQASVFWTHYLASFLGYHLKYEGEPICTDHFHCLDTCNFSKSFDGEDNSFVD